MISPYKAVVKNAQCGSKQTLDVLFNEEKVGEFERNYGSFGETTFAPFKKNDQWYALCSPNYTAISIMELPSCKIIGGEKSDDFGFCPVEIFVPTYQLDFTHATPKEELSKYPESNHCWLSRDRVEKEYDEECWEKDREVFYEDFAFVSGCIWGDDSSWKIEVRNISKANEGIIEDILEWGYHQLPHGLRLKECVELYAFQQFCDEPEEKCSINAKITVTKTIRLNRNEKGEYSLKSFD